MLRVLDFSEIGEMVVTLAHANEVSRRLMADIIIAYPRESADRLDAAERRR